MAKQWFFRIFNPSLSSPAPYLTRFLKHLSMATNFCGTNPAGYNHILNNHSFQPAIKTDFKTNNTSIQKNPGSMKRLFYWHYLLSGGIAKATNYYFFFRVGMIHVMQWLRRHRVHPHRGNPFQNSTAFSVRWQQEILSYSSVVKLFYGNIVIGKAGTSSNAIKFGAFGTGAKPVITGFYIYHGPDPT